MIKKLKWGTFFIILLFSIQSLAGAIKPLRKFVIYPSPSGEQSNKQYKVFVNSRKVPVYNAKIGAADNTVRFRAVDDLMHSADYYDTAAFAYFDLQGEVNVTVSIDSVIKNVSILPFSANIHAVIHSRSLSFKVSQPQNLTIEINGESVKSLHIFVNPIDNAIPDQKDPNVIYFGPGIHFVSHLIIGDNKTMYVAGGAIIRLIIDPDEKFGTEPSGLRNYLPRLILLGHHIKLCGHGIIDASACPTHSANIVLVKGEDIAVKGIIIRNSCSWTVPIRQSEHVVVDNVKILGYRANSDGIDICNSRDVLVNHCFVRTNDDLIVIKTEKGEGEAKHIIVRNCTLWNPTAHALSVGSELRERISDLLFTNCEIIHDRGREWALRVFQSDSTVVSNVRFENIRVNECYRLISLWIDKNDASYNKSLGYINQVSFNNITAFGNPLSIEIHGGDKSHIIDSVTFRHVSLNGALLTNERIEKNAFYKNIAITP